MATATVPVQTSSRVRLKYLLFGFIGLMIGYVLVHNESFLVHREIQHGSTIIHSAGICCRTDWLAPAPSCLVRCNSRIVCGSVSRNSIV